MDFLQNMEPLLQTFWFIAIPTSFIFLIQTVMTFMGVDSHDGTNADFSGHLSDADTPFQLFSLRNLMNFLLGLSWSGIGLYSTINNKTLLIIVSLLVGLVFVIFFFWLLKQMSRLAEDNSFQITNTLNKTAEVYIPIPANKQGKGKIMVSVNGAFHELEAMSENERLETSTVVKIVQILNGNVLLVEKL